MTHDQTQLQTYESISLLSTQMLEAARRSDWGRLTSLERDCSHLVDQLRRTEGGLAADDARRARKVEIIKKVLAEDAAIRDLVEPWMAELQALIGSTGRRRQLQQAYFPGRA